jgi:hypothetical protein
MFVVAKSPMVDCVAKIAGFTGLLMGMALRPLNWHSTTAGQTQSPQSIHPIAQSGSKHIHCGSGQSG